MGSGVVGWGGEVHLVDGLHGAQRRRFCIAAILPGGIGFERAFLVVPEQKVVAGKPWGADDGNGYVHEIGIIDHPLEGLHSAHGDAHDGMKMRELQGFNGQAVLGFDHILRGDGRELTPVLGGRG